MNRGIVLKPAVEHTFVLWYNDLVQSSDYQETTSMGNRAIKYRIYPTERQRTLIIKTIGSCRFV